MQDNDKIDAIVIELNKLLEPGVSPHWISNVIDQLAPLIKESKVSIDIIECRSYYENGELQRLHESKCQLMDNKMYELAATIQSQLKESIEKLRLDADTKLYAEPAKFERLSNKIIAHLKRENTNQRLIEKLFLDYNT